MSVDAPKPSERQPASLPETPEGNGRPETPVTPAQPPPTPAGQPSEFRLPERIPDAWARDIKNAVKESRTKLIITTVLSSSLLTGVLTTVGKYYLDERQEVARAARELKTERRKERRQLWDEMRTKLMAFRLQLDNLRNAAEFARAHPEDTTALLTAAYQMTTVFNRLSELEVVRNNIDDADLTKLMYDTFLPLTPKLADASQKPFSLREPTSMTALIDACEGVYNSGVADMSNLIEAKIQKLEQVEQ